MSASICQDNRWIVPYNPMLVTRYNAHINVEIVASFTVIKYLFKHIFKDHTENLNNSQQQCGAPRNVLESCILTLCMACAAPQAMPLGLTREPCM